MARLATCIKVVTSNEYRVWLYDCSQLVGVGLRYSLVLPNCRMGPSPPHISRLPDASDRSVLPCRLQRPSSFCFVHKTQEYSVGLQLKAVTCHSSKVAGDQGMSTQHMQHAHGPVCKLHDLQVDRNKASAPT